MTECRTEAATPNQGIGGAKGRVGTCPIDPRGQCCASPKRNMGVGRMPVKNYGRIRTLDDPAGGIHTYNGRVQDGEGKSVGPSDSSATRAGILTRPQISGVQSDL